MAVVVEYRVNFYDTDAMNVVHHANYIRWFEIGRVEYLRSLGITLDDLMSDGFVFPITEVKAKFLSPGHFDDRLSIETRATALTKVKMEFDYRIVSAVTGQLLVTGHTRNVFTAKDTGRITKLPPKYYERMERAMKSEQEDLLQEKSQND